MVPTHKSQGSDTMQLILKKQSCHYIEGQCVSISIYIYQRAISRAKQKVQHHLEHELQIKKTLESSAKMISREEKVSLRPHCRQKFRIKLTLPTWNVKYALKVWINQ